MYILQLFHCYRGVVPSVSSNNLLGLSHLARGDALSRVIAQSSASSLEHWYTTTYTIESAT